MAATEFFQRLIRGLKIRWNKIAFVLVLVLAALFGGYRARHYVTRESSYCLSCHGDTLKSGGLHEHKNQQCQDCHRSDFAAGVRIQVGSWFGSAKPGAHGQADVKNCKSCHLDPKGPKNIGAGSGHIVHVVNKPQLACSQCHQLKAHKTQPNEGACQTCHSKVTMHDNGMTRVTCLSCHDFKGPPTVKGTIPATGCVKCHSGQAPKNLDPSLVSHRVVSADAIHGNVNACRLCHNPHAPDATDRRRGMDCERCHSGVMAQHKKTAIEGHPDCATCHQVHGPRPKTPQLCAKCHEAKVPAPASAMLAGRHENCSSCHKPHLFKITRAACADCHKKENATLAAWTKDQHTDCLTCHQGHSESKPQANCVNCHKPKQNHGHSDCIKCHEPHGNKTAVKACMSCHSNEAAAIADQKPTPHRACLSCHDQHNRGATLGRCGTCHQKERAMAASSPTDTHKRCTSCHMPHLFQRVTTVCLNCHKQGDRAPHDGACLKCHQPHGVAASNALNCRGCHQSVPEIQGKHAQCTTCHSPHKSKTGGPVCTACHTSQMSGALSWTPAPHRDCASCHGRHGPLPPKPCAECHAPITSKPLFKGHRCLGCHNPHQPPAKPWFNKCVGCHATQAAATRGLPGKHASCQGCHEPHTDKLPSCQSCHQGRPGVHAAKGHEKCLSCHDSHAVKVQGRDKCVSCHKDKKDHFPAAARCAACHLFK